MEVDSLVVGGEDAIDGGGVNSPAPAVAPLPEEDAAEVELTVKFKTDQFVLSLPASALVADLQTRLAELTNVPPALQKLLFKGQLRPEQSLADAGLGPHAKLMLIGSTASDVQAVHEADARYRAALANRATIAKVRPRKPDVVSALGVRIGRVEILPGLPDQPRARQLLEQLAADNGIRNILQKHDWSIGVLKELSPVERTILGYNRNRGMEIALRLRTDNFQGFRHYHMIKSVLLHELAHMVHSEHDNNFHMLNRQLEKEAVQLDWTKSAGHRVGGADVNPDDPPAVDEDPLGGGSYTLGGNRDQAANQSPRELMLQAALIRLTAEEKTITDGCGSSQTSATSPQQAPSPASDRQRPSRHRPPSGPSDGPPGHPL